MCRIRTLKHLGMLLHFWEECKMKINDFYRIITYPSETLQRNNESPQWLMILLFVSVVEMLVAYFIFPFSNVHSWYFLAYFMMKSSLFS